jgi:Tol biopolymer transport system component
MIAEPSSSDRLDSWKEIAGHLRRDVKTVQRWERREGLPVHRQVHDKQSSVYAFRSEIDAWRIRLRTPPDRGAAFRHAAVVVSALAIVLAVAAGVWQYDNHDDNDAEGRETFTPASVVQVTFGAGAELFPSMSPDGRWIVYTAGVGNDADVFLQSTSGERGINLTSDFADSDSQAAFSPDGEWIAFRSERDGGGLFIMRRTGEDVTRVSRDGFNPSWAPDGRTLAYATEGVHLDPQIRQTTSVLLVVDVGGRARQLDVPDAVQPVWSPHGNRIAYWAVGIGSQRDIWTVSDTGGPPTRVTDDPALDWNPIWSGDGYIYFLSDRSGSMNVHRVKVDESSGTPAGPVEPFTLPASHVTHLTLSRDARQIAWSSLARRSNVQRIRFGDQHGMVSGEPQWVTRGSRRFGSPELSPDGEWLVMRDKTTESLFVGRADGTELRRLALPSGRYRDPRWAPDSHLIAFHSDIRGPWNIWTVARDGSGLERLDIHGDRDLALPTWAPDGQQLAVSDFQDESCWYLVDLRGQGPPRVTTKRAPYAFRPEDWSTDGTMLIGRALPLAGDEHAARGVVVYNLRSDTYAHVSQTGAWWPRWLRNSRQFITTEGGKVLLVDAVRDLRRVVLSMEHDLLSHPVVSRGGDWLYFVREQSLGDIWLATGSSAARGMPPASTPGTALTKSIRQMTSFAVAK